MASAFCVSSDMHQDAHLLKAAYFFKSANDQLASLSLTCLLQITLVKAANKTQAGALRMQAQKRINLPASLTQLSVWLTPVSDARL